VLVIDGRDNAIIGYADTQAGTVVVYQYEDQVEVFVEHGMDYEGAMDWIKFNVLNTHMGEQSPLAVFSSMIDELADQETSDT
jgi:hypothetical protein